MSKVKKKKKPNPNKVVEWARREEELKKYGKLLSLKTSICHKNKKKYTRKSKHKLSNNEN